MLFQDYLDIEDDTSYPLSSGTSDTTSQPGNVSNYHDIMIDIHQQGIVLAEEKCKQEDDEEDDSGHPCRTPPGQQMGSSSDFSTEVQLGSACEILTNIASPVLESGDDQWDHNDFSSLFGKHCLYGNQSPSASVSSRLHCEHFDWESCSKDSGMDDSSMTDSQPQRPPNNQVVSSATFHTSELSGVEMDQLLQIS